MKAYIKAFAIAIALLLAIALGDHGGKRRTQQRIVVRVFNYVNWEKVEKDNSTLKAKLDAIQRKADAEIHAPATPKDQMMVIAKKAGSDMTVERIRWLEEGQ